jgi:hypothetical protein
MYVNVNVKKMFHFIHVLCCHRTSDQSKGLVTVPPRVSAVA